MEERRNFLEGRPLSIISKGEGLRLARGEVFAPFIVSDGRWLCCDVVEGDTCSSVLCAVDVEAGVNVEAGRSEPFVWMEKVRMRRARCVTGRWRDAFSKRLIEENSVRR